MADFPDVQLKVVGSHYFEEEVERVKQKMEARKTEKKEKSKSVYE